MAAPQLSGFLAVSKPRGMTSNTPVYLIRKNFRGVKVGQTGTLDPLATGLLVIAIGEATKLVDYLDEGKKEYIAQFKLGEVSDTYDLAGTITTIDPAPDLTRVDILNTLDGYKGCIQQTPPIHSAIKVRGKPAYSYARKGVSVELKPRQVEIFNLELVWYSEVSQKASIRVICSKGTYIRSLVNDIGATLGCGAVMTKLSRLSSGEFSINSCLSYNKLLSVIGSRDLSKYIIDPRNAAYKLERLLLSPELSRRFSLGQKLALLDEDTKLEMQTLGDGLYIVCRTDPANIGNDQKGHPIGVGKFSGGVLHPERVLNVNA